MTKAILKFKNKYREINTKTNPITPEDRTVSRRVLTATDKSLNNPVCNPAGNLSACELAYSLTEAATSIVEARAVLVTVRLTDGALLKRPMVFSSSNCNVILAISESNSCPPLTSLRRTNFFTVATSGATPIPRSSMSPSLALREPPGKSSRLRVSALVTSDKVTCRAAITCGSTSTHNSH